MTQLRTGNRIFAQMTAEDDGDITDRPALTQIRGWLLKNRAYQPWKKARQFVQQRSIFFYWLDLTKQWQDLDVASLRACRLGTYFRGARGAPHPPL